MVMVMMMMIMVMIVMMMIDNGAGIVDYHNLDNGDDGDG